MSKMTISRGGSAAMAPQDWERAIGDSMVASYRASLFPNVPSIATDADAERLLGPEFRGLVSEMSRYNPPPAVHAIAPPDETLRYGNIVSTGAGIFYDPRVGAAVSTEVIPEVVRLARERDKPVTLALWNTHVIVRPGASIVDVTTAWMSAREGVVVDVGPSKSDVDALAGSLGVERRPPVGHSVRLPRPTSAVQEEAAARAFCECIAGMKAWTGSPDGQRAARDRMVAKAIADVPAGCDASRWANVVRVIAADAVEGRSLAEQVPFMQGYLPIAIGAVAPICVAYGHARFVFGYSVADAVRDVEQRCCFYGLPRGGRRILAAYEAGR